METINKLPKSPGVGRNGMRPPGGSRKGIPNKATGDLKAMILGALDKAGGVAYLQRQADANPGAFMALVGKVLPMTVAGDPNAPLLPAVINVIAGKP